MIFVKVIGLGYKSSRKDVTENKGTETNCPAMLMYYKGHDEQLFETIDSV